MTKLARLFLILALCALITVSGPLIYLMSEGSKEMDVVMATQSRAVVRGRAGTRARMKSDAMLLFATNHPPPTAVSQTPPSTAPPSTAPPFAASQTPPSTALRTLSSIVFQTPPSTALPSTAPPSTAPPSTASTAPPTTASQTPPTLASQTPPSTASRTPPSTSPPSSASTAPPSTASQAPPSTAPPSSASTAPPSTTSQAPPSTETDNNPWKNLIVKSSPFTVITPEPDRRRPRPLPHNSNYKLESHRRSKAGPTFNKDGAPYYARVRAANPADFDDVQLEDNGDDNGFIARDKVNDVITRDRVSDVITRDRVNDVITRDNVNDVITRDKVNGPTTRDKVNGFVATDKVGLVLEAQKRYRRILEYYVEILKQEID